MKWNKISQRRREEKMEMKRFADSHCRTQTDGWITFDMDNPFVRAHVIVCSVAKWRCAACTWKMSNQNLFLFVWLRSWWLVFAQCPRLLSRPADKTGTNRIRRHRHTHTNSERMNQRNLNTKKRKWVPPSARSVRKILFVTANCIWIWLPLSMMNGLMQMRAAESVTFGQNEEYTISLIDNWHACAALCMEETREMRKEYIKSKNPNRTFTAFEIYSNFISATTVSGLGQAASLGRKYENAEIWILSVRIFTAFAVMCVHPLCK